MAQPEGQGSEDSRNCGDGGRGKGAVAKSMFANQGEKLMPETVGRQVRPFATLFTKQFWNPTDVEPLQ